MDNQNELSFEQYADLAKEKPLEWVKAFIEINELGSYASEYGANNDTQAVGGYILIEVNSEGGCEGGGDHAEVTYAIAPVGNTVKNGRVENAVAYVEWVGFYSSYDGTDWDQDPYVVEPKDVVVVKYFVIE